MIRILAAGALALVLASPLSAQTPMGLQMRLDQSTMANDPDDVPDVTVTSVDNGFEVRTGPAAVIWDPSNTASGTYTLHGTFRLLERSNHTNYYGLVLGGSDLDGPSQNYLYFLVAQNGAFLLKHRMGDEVHDIVPSTPHAAVAGMDAGDAPSTNEIEVRVTDDVVDFVVNGTVVHTTPTDSLAASTDGLYGVRINHVLPRVAVEGLGISR